MNGGDSTLRGGYLGLFIVGARLAAASFVRMAMLVLVSRVIDFFIVTLMEYFGLIAMDLFYVLSSAISAYSIGVLFLRFTLFWLTWLSIAYGWMLFRPPPKSHPQQAPLVLPTGTGPVDTHAVEARLAKFFQ
jgi:cbb3-type cytochrome oxidase subunit 3